MAALVAGGQDDSNGNANDGRMGQSVGDIYNPPEDIVDAATVTRQLGERLREGEVSPEASGTPPPVDGLEPVSEPLPPDAPEPQAVLPEPVVEPVEAAALGGPGALTVSLTYYVCTNAPPGQSYCGTMSSGATVYEGAAACGGALALGTRFSIVGEGRVYVCEDRGLGGYYWIDIFHYDYYAGRAWRSQWPQSVEIQVEP